jgi:CRP-like cAMP-binding protein
VAKVKVREHTVAPLSSATSICHSSPAQNLLPRSRIASLAEGPECELPMTQAELGDALGIPTVHVNRTLQELRAAGLITLRGARLTVLDWEELKTVGEFDPAYLHLRQKAAA